MEGGSPAGDAARAPAALTKRQRWLLRGGVSAVALIAGLVAWLATRDTGPSTATPEPASRIVSEAELAEASVLLGQPIYWAGPMPGRELELTEVAEGVRVTYIPEGTGVEDAPTRVLTVGSYLLPNPTKSVERYARHRGAIVRHLSDGRLLVTTRSLPESVYFASRDNSVQVEVFDPSAKRAMSLALSKRIEPVR